MAKDKGKKDKGTKGGEGFSDDFGKPSEAPAGGDGFRLEDEEHLGKLLLITPLRVKDDAVGFENKIQEVIVADVVVINEKKPEKSEEHTGVWIWGGWTKGALRGFVNKRRVPARLGQDKAKGRGKNAAWVLEDASEKDIEKIREYLGSVDPFKQKGAPDDGDADEPKGKKSKGGDDAKSGKKAKGEPEAKADKGGKKKAKK